MASHVTLACAGASWPPEALLVTDRCERIQRLSLASRRMLRLCKPTMEGCRQLEDFHAKRWRNFAKPACHLNRFRGLWTMQTDEEYALAPPECAPYRACAAFIATSCLFSSSPDLIVSAPHKHAFPALPELHLWANCLNLSETGAHWPQNTLKSLLWKWLKLMAKRRVVNRGSY